MAANKEMPEWIKFFTAAGIPAGPAVKYAVVFLDNRIQKSMLMDLTKEYLKEMGISIMGDVIAILKYAKTAHMRYESEKPAIAALTMDPEAKVELKRQTTPGNRMLEHYMRKEGIIEGGASKVTVSPTMAVRLGAVPTAGPKKGPGDTAEVTPAKRPRMVKPEEEGKYIVSMPKGTTPKTQKIMEQQKQQQQEGAEEDRKSSVFARLGSGKGTPTVPLLPKKAENSPGQVAVVPSVFNRLGDQRKRVSSQGLDTSSVVEYQGVLKTLSSPHAQMSKTSLTKVTDPPTTKVTLAAPRVPVQSPKDSLQTRLCAPNTTPKLVGAAVRNTTSLESRLGAPVLKAKGAVSSTVGTKQKMCVTIGGQKKTTTGALRRSMIDRLGVQTPEVSTTTHMDSVGVRSKVQDRLGGDSHAAALASKGAVKPNTGKPPLKRSMQARLGEPARSLVQGTMPQPASMKQTVTVTIGRMPASVQKAPGGVKGPASPAGTKLLKRLGAPVTSVAPKQKVNIQNRLGVMRAEVSSTTPSVTVTLGGTGGNLKKRMSSSPNLIAKSNVFSRLGS